MKNTAMNTGAQSAPAKPLAWQSKNLWGAVGMTHFTEVEIGDNTYRFVLDQPRQHEWQARGWVNGSFCLFRSQADARTLRDMKALIAAYVADLRDKAVAK